jgi:hypothetical protein
MISLPVRDHYASSLPRVTLAEYVRLIGAVLCATARVLPIGRVTTARGRRNGGLGRPFFRVTPRGGTDQVGQAALRSSARAEARRNWPGPSPGAWPIGMRLTKGNRKADLSACNPLHPFRPGIPSHAPFTTATPRPSPAPCSGPCWSTAWTARLGSAGWWKPRRTSALTTLPRTPLEDGPRGRRSCSDRPAMRTST